MSRYPLIPPEVALVSLPGKGLCALHGDDAYWFSGDGWDRLFPLLDGQHSVREIRRSSRHPFARDFVSRFLRRMLEQGWLEETPEPVAPAATVHPARILAHRIKNPERAFPGGVTFLAPGGDGKSHPEALLPETDPRGLALLLVEDITDPAIAGFAKKAREEKKPWLPAQPGGIRPILGPLFHPGATPCWFCLRERRKPLAQALFFLRRETGRDVFPPLRRRVRDEVVATFLRLLAGFSGDNPQSKETGCLLSFPQNGDEPRKHRLLPRPECPDCGDPNLFGRSLHRFDSDNDDLAFGAGRLQTAAELSVRLNAMEDPVLGPVTRTEKKPAEEPSYPATCLAWHVRARDIRSWRQLSEERLFPSGGSGRDETSARGTALAEALERLSSLARGDEPVIATTPEKLDAAWLAPNALMHFAEAQLQQSFRTDGDEAGWNAIPAPWTPEQPIPWVRGWSLAHERPVYLPARYCFFESTPGRPPHAICTSNGVASGSDSTEALIHGFLEIVERDAAAMWWYLRCARPPVRSGDPALDELLGRANQALAPRRRSIHLLDLTHDTGLPVVAAISLRDGRRDGLFGFGCHFQSLEAARKAIREVFYQLNASASGEKGREDPLSRFVRSEDLGALPWLSPQPGATVTGAAPDRPGPDRTRADTLAWCVQKTRELGTDFVALNLTRPDLGWPTARVVVPPFRHFWPRLGPGRLYDVPRRLNWIRESPPPEQTNPVPFTL